MSAGVVATQMMIIFIFMIIGYVLTKKGKFSETTSHDMSFLIINICCPAMMLSGVLSDQSITPQHLVEMGIVVALIYAFLILLALFMGPLLRVEENQRKYYKLMTVFGNIGFIGYPVINAVIGGSGMSYAALFNLGFNLLIFTYGVIVLNRDADGQKQQLQWKKLINAGTGIRCAGDTGSDFQAFCTNSSPQLSGLSGKYYDLYDSGHHRSLIGVYPAETGFSRCAGLSVCGAALCTDPCRGGFGDEAVYSR